MESSQKDNLAEELLILFSCLFLLGLPIVLYYLFPFFPKLIGEYSPWIFLTISIFLFFLGLYFIIGRFIAKIQHMKIDSNNFLLKMVRFAFATIHLLVVLSAFSFGVFMYFFISSGLIRIKVSMSEPFEKTKWASNSQKRIGMVRSLLEDVKLIGKRRNEVEELLGLPSSQKAISRLTYETVYSLGEYDFSLVKEPSYLFIWYEDEVVTKAEWKSD